MKKIFLSLSALVAISSHAQKKGVFDVERYLLNKGSTPVIKRSNDSIHVFFINPDIANSEKGKFSHSLANGDKLFILPQDKMPCIVPGQKITTTPNVSNPDTYFKELLAEKNRNGRIPNGIKPYIIIETN